LSQLLKTVSLAPQGLTDFLDVALDAPPWRLNEILRPKLNSIAKQVIHLLDFRVGPLKDLLRSDLAMLERYRSSRLPGTEIPAYYDGAHSCWRKFTTHDRWLLDELAGEYSRIITAFKSSDEPTPFTDAVVNLLRFNRVTLIRRTGRTTAIVTKAYQHALETGNKIWILVPNRSMGDHIRDMVESLHARVKPEHVVRIEVWVLCKGHRLDQKLRGYTDISIYFDHTVSEFCSEVYFEFREQLFTSGRFKAASDGTDGLVPTF
jgi:hypothetical protein